MKNAIVRSAALAVALLTTVGCGDTSSAGSSSTTNGDAGAGGGNGGIGSSSSGDGGVPAQSGSDAGGPTSGGSGGFGVRVDGNRLVDGSGATIQLRGYNVSGLEFVAIQGGSDPWGDQIDATSGWAAVKAKGANTVRLPLNEASWLGGTCTGDASGALVQNRNPDPGGNYRDTVKKSVASANAAGLYVILDLHLAAPGSYCPQKQTFLPDKDHAPAFWTSVATTFEDNHAVLFELYNEPISGPDNGDAVAEWKQLRDGGSVTGFSLVSAGGSDIDVTWQTAGMQDLLDAVRATGATNVVLASGLMWARSFTSWLAYAPNDSLHQLAAVWHVYSFGNADSTYNEPAIFTQAQAILDAGIPIVMTEIADSSSTGQMVKRLTDWADAHTVSYSAWAWNSWADPGTYFPTHLAACGGKATCP